MKYKAMRFLLLSSIGAIGISSCSSEEKPSGHRAEEISPGNVQTVLPDVTLDDWVSYSQQVSLVSVLKESEIPPPKEVLERQEGYVGRVLTLKVDQTLWMSPGSGPKMLAEQTFEIVAQGWIMRSGRKAEAGVGNAVRLLPGGKYVMPLAKFERGWGPITPGASFATTGDQIASEDMTLRGAGPLAKSLATKPLEDIKASLQAAKIDPIAMKYAHLPAEQQIRAVQAERAKSENKN